MDRLYLLTVKRVAYERLEINCYKNGILFRSGVWRSRTKALDLLKQSGALPTRRMKWPRNFGDETLIEVKNPVTWFWED